MTTIVVIARRLAISERAAARELEAAVAREFMHRQLVESGLHRSRKNHRLVVRNAHGSPDRLRPPRRFPDVLAEDRGCDSPAAWVAPARSRWRRASRLPPKGTRAVIVTTSPTLLAAELEQLPLGEPFQTLAAEATAAIAADRAAAVASCSHRTSSRPPRIS